MPVWTRKQASDLQVALAEVMHELEAQVADNPTFAEVAGLRMEELVSHATEALKPILSAAGEPEHLANAVQAYCLGFVVGKKFGERHINHREEHDHG